MKHIRTMTALAVLLALGATANAQSETSREQVKTETLQAIRTGDMLIGGEVGMTARQLYANQHPRRAPDASPVTRAQVKTELARAMANGEVLPEGESSDVQRLAQIHRSTPASTLTRSEVKSEVAAAIRSGAVMVSGEVGLQTNQLYPQRSNSATAQAKAGRPAQSAGF